MPIHASLHDVSPTWERECEMALDMTHAHGVRPALLVVPNFHGEAPLLEFPAFCARLRALQTEGHEVYLHGYFHEARSWAEKARQTSDTGARARLGHVYAQRIVSGGEAEFSDVSRSEARERLINGEQTLRSAGLRIDGFVAPAWSMPSWMHELLRDRGYTFTEDHTRVYNPSTSRSRASVVLNYASRTPARLFSSVAWCRIARPARRILPTRIAIHPADMRYALLRREVESLLAWGRGDFVERGETLLR
jgi:predicted deacetylase